MCAEILHGTGTRATIIDGEFETRPADSYFPVIPDDLGRRIRTTAAMAAALLARSGKVTFPLPGGDAFCARAPLRRCSRRQVKSYGPSRRSSSATASTAA